MAECQAGDRVEVTFEHAAARSFDLVVGADGLHSAVREPASRFGSALPLLRSEYISYCDSTQFSFVSLWRKKFNIVRIVLSN
jgi:hypothetical protein